MAIKALTKVTTLTFSGLETPQHHHAMAQNLIRVSICGALSSGSAALVSFIFSRSLVQEGSWKAFAPHVFKASAYTCATFAIVVAFSFCIIATGRILGEPLNDRVSLFAKGYARIGLIGAAAAGAVKCVISNTHVSSLAKHSLYPLLGMGIAGSVLWIFHSWQNIQFETKYAKTTKI
jgi:hypothetical protein